MTSCILCKFFAQWQNYEEKEDCGIPKILLYWSLSESPDQFHICELKDKVETFILSSSTSSEGYTYFEFYSGNFDRFSNRIKLFPSALISPNISLVPLKIVMPLQAIFL